MTDEERIADLLLVWEEKHESGIELAAEELSRAGPHLIPELARRIHALKVTSWLAKADDHEPPSATNDPGVPPPMPLAARYRLDDQIGEGGFAQVWKGFDLELRRSVAVKLPKASRLLSAERFVAEARRVAGLKHPGVVPVFDVGHDGDSYFIVSELVEGGSLADCIAAKRPTPQEAVRLMAEVADTLAYAHRQGFVHRDIKPGNILLDHHGRALLADFGIARSPDDTTSESAAFGTLAYMAPEQLEGKPADHRADIYALGVVLYELLTGNSPYGATDPVELRRQIVSDPLPMISDTAGVSAQLVKVCLKCLSRDPADRYQDAAQLAHDLRATTGILPWHRRRLFTVFGLLVFVGAAGVVGWKTWPDRRADAEGGKPNPPVAPEAGERWERVGMVGGRGVLQSPVGVAWTREGNLLVANSSSGRMSVFDRNGKLLREFGEAGRQPHQLRHPHSVCVTSSGNILVSDHGNNRILVYSPDYSWIKSIGEAGNELGQFNHPEGIACDDHDNLFVADSHNHRIQVLDATGKPVRQFGTQGSGPGQLHNPIGVALDEKGKVYVGDTENRRIQVFDTDGGFVRELGGPKVEARGIAVQPGGCLIVADTLNKWAMEFDPEGRYVGPLPYNAGQNFYPIGVAIAPDGLVAVANYARHEVYLYRVPRP